MTEATIQNQIRIALSPYGMIFRTNSGEFWQGKSVFSKEFNKRVLINLRHVDGLPKGFADLTFFGFDGRPAFIEVKQPGETPKPEQIHFAELMQSHGYRAGTAWSVEDALKLIGVNRYG